MSSKGKSCLWELTDILSLKARGLTSLSSKETIPVSPFAFVEEVFANAVFVAVVPGKEMMVNCNQAKSPPHKETKKIHWSKNLPSLLFSLSSSRVLTLETELHFELLFKKRLSWGPLHSFTSSIGIL